MNAWILAIVLTVVLPGGRVAVERGRADRTFTLEQCLAALQTVRAADVPPSAPGARVVAFEAACLPSQPPARQTRPRLSGRDYEA